MGKVMCSDMYLGFFLGDEWLWLMTRYDYYYVLFVVVTAKDLDTISIIKF